MNRIADAKSEDVGRLSNFRSPYFSQEHEMLRAQVRRFVETEIKPKALAWEEQGYVPREVLRRMGSLGFLGIRYPARYGGSEMDTLASVVLAEELGCSTFTGFFQFAAPNYADGGLFAIMGNELVVNGDLSGLAGTMQSVTIQAVQN